MNKRLAITVLLICSTVFLSARPVWQIDFRNLTDDVKNGIQLKGPCEITPEGIVTTSDTAKAHAVLQGLAAQFTPKTDEEKALLAEAQELVKVPAELSESWTKFTKAPKVIEDTRIKIDKLIQRLQ